MKYWEYVEPGPNDEPIVQRVSEEWILKNYFSYWLGEMEKSGAFARYPHLDTLKKQHEACIEDFVIIHWASSVKE